jgi:hypothetical protein
MKKNRLSPSLEFAFAFGVTAILTLPLLVKAQDSKEFKVNINNADTTVNGKNIKELSADERKDALKKINQLNDHITITTKSDDGNTFVYKSSGSGDAQVVEQMGKLAPVMAYSLSTGNNGKSVTLKSRNGEVMSSYSLSESAAGDNAPRKAANVFSYLSRGNNKNTQNFSYSNTDNDGISTHVNFSVADAGTETMKKISGKEKADLEVNDLNLVPAFSTGKTVLSFSLAAKTAADVEFKNSEGTVLWSSKTANGDFSKSFELPKNGVYYLQVKQGGKLALRRITKQE